MTQNIEPNPAIPAAVATLAQHGYRAHRDERRADGWVVVNTNPGGRRSDGVTTANLIASANALNEYDQ